MRKLTRINEDFNFIKFLNSKVKREIPEINDWSKNGNFEVDEKGLEINRGTPVNIGTTTSGNAVFEELELNEDAVRKLNDTLNEKIFVKNKAGRYVLRLKAKEFIENFVSFYQSSFEEECAPLKLPIKDVVLVGSNVAYNYTENSDLDIHIIADRPKTSSLKEIYWLFNKIFKRTYEGITFRGIPIESYIELADTEANSAGIYSLKHGWIKYPQKEWIKVFTSEEERSFDAEFKKWEDRYFNIVGKDNIKTTEDNKEVKEDVE